MDEHESELLQLWPGQHLQRVANALYPVCVFLAGGAVRCAVDPAGPHRAGQLGCPGHSLPQQTEVSHELLHDAAGRSRRVFAMVVCCS
jgi:hypothetical protein